MRKWSALCVIVFALILLYGCRNSVKSQPQKTVDLPELRIGCDEYEPYNYSDEYGKRIGIDAEIATEACRRMGMKPVFVSIKWDEKDELLEEKQIDCAWNCFSMNDRKDAYQWAGPYLKSREMVVVAKDSSIKSIKDLEGKIVGIMHILNDSLSDVVQSDETKILYGQDYFYETLLGLKFRISTFSFFQPNSLAAEVLYNIVRDYIQNTSGMEVFDLYSGTGTIAQLLAPVAKEVIGVEIVEDAVAAARENAKLNGLDNCKFIAGDVLKVLDDLTEKPDVIVLDPPRDGIHPKALPKILSYGVNRIVYVSCKATSLARDLEAFLQAGYRLEKACCVDQFCETVWTEAVALLVKE